MLTLYETYKKTDMLDGTYRKEETKWLMIKKDCRGVIS